MITGIFGKPRSGKTTYAARLVQKNKATLNLCNKLPGILGRIARRILHPYDVIYCTDETIQDTVYVDYRTLGKWQPTRNSLLVIEEAGILFNNRHFKTLSNEATRLFALHGHLGCDIWWSSQSVDVDRKLLSRTHRIYMCARFLWWSMLTPIKFSVDVDEETKQLVDAYTMPRRLAWLFAFIFGRVKVIWRPKWYKYFDSFNDGGEYTMEDPAKQLEDTDDE